jgi:hypothetical protein
MTLNGMYRISAKDADALGKESANANQKTHTVDAPPADEDQIRENLKSVLIRKFR